MHIILAFLVLICGILPLEAAQQIEIADHERELYLSTGGIYTLEDILANGTQTPWQKFRGFMAAHNAHPKEGEKICPITLTKAHPNCTWVVGGKTYHFCCPPCIEEFLVMAKETPHLIKDPEEYVKR